MLSEQWLIIKWIKHVAAQVGSGHPFSWNVEINSQWKKSFFQPIMIDPPKGFQSRFDPRHGYKTVNKRSQRQSTLGTAIREKRHLSHFRQDQRPQMPGPPTPQSTHHKTLSPAYLHKTKTFLSLPTHVTPPCSTQPSQPVKEQLKPTHLLTSIGWKKKACIFSNLPTFIYLK